MTSPASSPATFPSPLFPRFYTLPSNLRFGPMDTSLMLFKAAVPSLPSKLLSSLPALCQANNPCSSDPNWDGTSFPDSSHWAGCLFSCALVTLWKFLYPRKITESSSLSLSIFLSRRSWRWEVTPSTPWPPAAQCYLVQNELSRDCGDMKKSVLTAHIL